MVLHIALIMHVDPSQPYIRTFHDIPWSISSSTFLINPLSCYIMISLDSLDHSSPNFAIEKTQDPDCNQIYVGFETFLLTLVKIAEKKIGPWAERVIQ